MVRIKFKTKQDRINGFYELATKGRGRGLPNGIFEIGVRYLIILDEAGIGYEIIQAGDGCAGELKRRQLLFKLFRRNIHAIQRCS